MKIISISNISFRYRFTLVSILISVIPVLGIQVEFSKTYDCQPIKISSSFKSFYLKNEAKVYTFRNDKSVDEVLSLVHSGQIRESRPAFDDYIWVFFCVYNADQKDAQLILEIDNPHIGYYELYQFSKDNIKLREVGKGGDSLPFGYRQIANRRFLEEFSHAPKSEMCYLLKIDDREVNTSLALTLWNKDYFYEQETKESLFYNLYFGGLIFIAALGLVIGFILRLKVFYSYGLYAFIMALYMFTYLGFSYQHLYPDNTDLKRYLNIFLIIPLVFSFTGFSSCYFRITRNNRYVFWLVQIQYLLSFFTILIWLVTRLKFRMHYFIIANYVLIAYTILILVTLMITEFKRNKTKAVFYIVAVSVLSLSGIIFGFADAGILSMDMFPANPLLMGSVFEFGIFTIALVYEVKSINETKNNLLTEHARQQEDLLKAYVKGAEKERSRLSAELHDNIGSRLALLKNRIINVKPDDNDLIEDVGSLYQNVRSMSHELSPGDFHVIRFEEYLYMYLQKYKKTTGLEVKLFVNNIPRLNANIANQLFRVVQEAAQNVQKHAKASTFEVQLISHEDEFVMTLDDDGQGFEPDIDKRINSGGIANMHTRIKSLGGTIEISSVMQKGTHIIVNIPLAVNT